MAATSESDYFPSLDKCLAGNERLISWRTAYRLNFQHETAVTGSPAYRFIESSEAESILRNALNPFPLPSATTKSEFETKTAPIQVAQSSNGEYNLEEIKKDALWLSAEVKIGELHALRMAIIEWQERPANRILLDYAGAQNTAPADQSFNSTSLAQSTANFLSSTIGNTGGPADTEDARKERLIRVFLEEKESILKYHVDNGVVKDFRNEGPQAHPWIDSLACIEFIKAEFSEDAQTRDPQYFKTTQEKQMLLLDSKARRLIQALRALLSRNYASRAACSTKLVKEWFHLMEKLAFLQDPQNVTLEQDVSPINCLVALVSLSMLSLPQAIGQLEESLSNLAHGGAQYPDLGDNSNDEYFLDQDCVGAVQKVLSWAACCNITVAGPAIYAWGLITARIRDMATIQKRIRERNAIQDGTNKAETRLPSKEEGIWEKRFKTVQEYTDQSDAQEDPPLFLAQSAVDGMNVYALIVAMGNVTSSSWDSNAQPGTAFESRFTLFDLLRESLAVVPYSTDVLEAILSVFGSEHDGKSASDIPFSHLLARTFLDDDEQFRPRVLSQALVRYPYELSPMLRLLTKLACASSTSSSGPPEVVQILEKLERLTMMVPANFRAYRLESEDEGSNEMLLTDNLAVFRHRKATFFGQSGQRAIGHGDDNRPREVVSVPAGASGMIVKEEPPRVLSLTHPHSGFHYLGLLLATRLPNSEFIPAIPESTLDRGTAADVINLISAVLLACLRQQDGAQEAIAVLDSLSTELLVHGQQGIVPVIADTFEMELLAHLDQAPEDGSLDLSIACVGFFNTLSEISPEKVWAMLSRSSLLGANGGASALAAVVGGTEVPLGQYRFLTSCVRLYSNLLKDAVCGLVKRKAPIRKATNRFDTPSEHIDLTPERVMQSVLSSYQRVVLDAFQDLKSLRFISPGEKQYIASTMMTSFTTVIRWTYGLEDPVAPNTKVSNEQKDKIASVLQKPAEMILRGFVSEGNASPLISALGDLFTSGVDAADNDLPIDLRASLIRQVESTCGLATALVQTARQLSPKNAAIMGAALLRGMPVFVALHATESSYKAPLSVLLGELVQSVAFEDNDPMSVLGPLSPETSKLFLAIISQLDRPICDEEVEAKMWDFLATVLGGRQQWFAIYLLTGTLPKSRSKKTESNDTAKAKSLLTLALDELSKITLLAPERAKAMLKFVAVAQNVWIWATNDIRSRNDFLQQAVAFLQNLQKNASRSKTSEVLLANELQMAAYLCDIFAVSIHAGLETGDKALLTLLKDNMTFFAERAAMTDAYKHSLHQNLARNLKSKYPQCNLMDFKRSTANPAPYGESFFYDLELAATVLDHDLAWNPGAIKERNAGRGFVDEFRRANTNLSVVDAQINLLNSWKALASALCECIQQETTLQGSLAKAAVSCLEANASANLDVPGMAAILQTRAELAFGIISKLVSVRSADLTMKHLLPVAWDIVNSAPVDYDVASASDDLRYYRLLLQILYLSIQPYTYIEPDASFRPARDASKKDEPEIYLLTPGAAVCLVEIVRKTIAPGFRALCGNLHSNIQLALPGDFALLTGLLQAVLSVYGVASVHQQIAEVVQNSSVIRGALSLYSWADQLAEAMDDDPVYGEVSMNFLLALSSVPQIAEQMALDGVLSQLANANLSNYFRKPGGKGPFDEPRRMFGIWNQGFLPLSLNVLDAVGPPMAAEVTGFINSFPQQLRRAETALQPTVPSLSRPHAGDVTLGLLTEAHNLLVIGRVLQSDIARGAADGVNASEIPPLDLNLTEIRDHIAALPRTTRSLGDKIVATNEREAMWAATPVTGSSDNLLAQKIHREMIEAGAVFGPNDAP